MGARPRDGAQCSGSPPLSLPRCCPLLEPLSAHGGSRRLFSLAIAVEDMEDWMRIRWCGWVPAATGVVGNCPGPQTAVQRAPSTDDDEFLLYLHTVHDEAARPPR
ncbi:hypothetical protein J3F83DRAFT_723164 [Trichoderma novae-zelandiae]